MATFATFNDRLPDPTFLVTEAGSVGATGQKGPGFASVRLTSNENTQVSRTISGRGVHRTGGSQNWDISITYNPMLRDEFDIIDSFLQGRRGRLKTFFVVLPQYSKPKDPTFAAYAASTPILAASAHAAGTDALNIDANGAVIGGTPRIGDYFTITDVNDINHLKAYKVIGVESSSLYQTGTTQPAVNTFRLHINPPLQRFTSDNSVINFINPKFRVMQKGDTIESELSTDNLYQFGLSLEEIQP